jgi:hypothetical protein
MSYKITFAKEHSFPKPKFQVVRDVGNRKNASKIFEYWKSIPAAKQDLVVFKIYRMWPLTDMKAVDPKANLETDTISGPLPFEPDDYQNFFRERYGAGEWKCYLCEQSVGIVMAAFFSAHDNWQECPPKLDYRMVIRGPFANKEYVSWLERQPGLDLPWTKDPEREQEKQDQMNVGNVTTTLVDALVRKTERLEEEVEEYRDADQVDPDEKVEAHGAEKAMDLVAEGSKQAIGIIAEQAKQIANAKAPVPSYDPMAMVEKVLTLTGVGHNNGDGKTLEIMNLFLSLHEKSLTAVQTMQKETLDFMREQHEDRAEQRETAVAVQQRQNPSGFDSFLEQGQKMKQMAELFGWSTSSRRREMPEIPEAPPSKPWYQAWVENPTLLITGLTLTSNIVYNVFNRGAGKPPQEALAEAAKQAAELTKGVSGNGATVTAIDQAENQKKAMLAFMEMIEPVFIAHYFDRESRGLDGFTFAEVFLTMRNTASGQIMFVPDGPPNEVGLAQYDAIKQGGLENFDRAIRNYHPIWSLVQGNIAKYTGFLKQFFTYKEEAERRAKEPAES